MRLIESFAAQSSLEIILKEGRNRQIRRIAEQLGYPVIKLHRTAIGPIKLEIPKQPYLKEGKYRSLKDDEMRFLRQQIKHIPIKDSAELRSVTTHEMVKQER